MSRWMDWICFLLVLLAFLEGAAAVTSYTVGGTTGWTVPSDPSFYDDWVSSKTFLAGDSLVFNWTSSHNVLEVTSNSEYDGCTKTNGVLHESSPVTVPLPANATRHFICTIGSHCQLGQKVTVKVGSGISSSPPPNSANPSLPINAFSPAFLSAVIFLYLIPSIDIPHIIQ